MNRVVLAVVSFVVFGSTVLLTATAPTSTNELSRAGDPVVGHTLSVLHLVSILLGWYLLVTTGMSAFSRVFRLDALKAFSDRVTIPAVRLFVSSAFGASVLVPPASALAYESPPVAVEEERPPTMRLIPPAAERSERTPEIRSGPTAVAPTTTTATSAVTGDVVIVKPGDHLWSIAARHVEDRLGERPDDAQVARYWRLVVDLNTPRLASRDPDLIRPGEEIVLPSFPADWSS